MTNASLPILPAWHARSFYASILLLLTVIANTLGYDLMPVLGRLGLGSTPDGIVDKIMTLAPLAFGFWAWWERRAPNYRLSLAPSLIASSARAWVRRLWERIRSAWQSFWSWEWM